MSGTSPQRSPRRRRQRSVRVTVAGALLSTATILVGVAVAGGSPRAVAVAAVISTLAGWAAVRILLRELRQARREAARDLAAQADSYRRLFATRSVEHAAYVAAMAARLARAADERDELESVLQLSERRAGEAEARVRREARRANDAEARMVDLEEQLEVLRGVEDDTLAVWEPGTEPAVVDLLAWEDRATATRADRVPRQRLA